MKIAKTDSGGGGRGRGRPTPTNSDRATPTNSPQNLEKCRRAGVIFCRRPQGRSHVWVGHHAQRPEHHQPQSGCLNVQ
eukprot:1196114-Prorocentrum_minimum.AAC.10